MNQEQSRTELLLELIAEELNAARETLFHQGLLEEANRSKDKKRKEHYEEWASIYGRALSEVSGRIEKLRTELGMFSVLDKAVELQRVAEARKSHKG